MGDIEKGRRRLAKILLTSGKTQCNIYGNSHSLSLSSSGEIPLKKNWTILLVPHDNVKVRDFILTRPVIVLSVIVLCVGIVGAFLLGFGYYTRSISAGKLHNLEKENEALRGKVTDLAALTDNLQSRLQKLDSIEAEYRMIAGLSGIDPEVKKAGIGGPGRNGAVDRELEAIGRDARTKIKTSEESLNALVRQADILQQSLTESVEQLKFFQDRLNHTPSVWPTVGRLTSHYGSRVHPIFNGIRKHEGIDISAPRGTPVVATADGKVIYARWKLGYGQAIEIDHGYDHRTFYAHLSSIKVRQGQHVKRGEIIGLVGNTGVSTGPHLHYEVKVSSKSTNPLNYILGYTVPD
jgi:murein DD-endopeptidase MepM/ murein hydrolase activator NlpD